MPVELGPGHRTLLESARRATLATIGPAGRPRLVPCCFALLEDGEGPVLVTPIDDKPKHSADPRALARVRDIERDARVTLLVDRWAEDWTQLAWLRLEGEAHVTWPDGDAWQRRAAIRALRDRYPQYLQHDLESLPVIRVTLTAVQGWTSRLPD